MPVRLFVVQMNGSNFLGEVACASFLILLSPTAAYQDLDDKSTLGLLGSPAALTLRLPSAGDQDINFL